MSIWEINGGYFLAWLEGEISEAVVLSFAQTHRQTHAQTHTQTHAQTTLKAIPASHSTASEQVTTFQNTTYTDVVNSQVVEFPGAIDPVQYVSHCSRSIIEWIEDSATNPTWKCPR